MVTGLFKYGAFYYLRYAAMNGWMNWKDAESNDDGLYIALYIASRH